MLSLSNFFLGVGGGGGANKVHYGDAQMENIYYHIRNRSRVVPCKYMECFSWKWMKFRVIASPEAVSASTSKDTCRVTWSKKMFATTNDNFFSHTFGEKSSFWKARHIIIICTSHQSPNAINCLRNRPESFLKYSHNPITPICFNQLVQIDRIRHFLDKQRVS